MPSPAIEIEETIYDPTVFKQQYISYGEIDLENNHCDPDSIQIYYIKNFKKIEQLIKESENNNPKAYKYWSFLLSIVINIQLNSGGYDSDEEAHHIPRNHIQIKEPNTGQFIVFLNKCDSFYFIDNIKGLPLFSYIAENDTKLDFRTEIIGLDGVNYTQEVYVSGKTFQELIDKSTQDLTTSRLHKDVIYFNTPPTPEAYINHHQRQHARFHFERQKEIILEDVDEEPNRSRIKFFIDEIIRHTVPNYIRSPISIWETPESLPISEQIFGHLQHVSSLFIHCRLPIYSSLSRQFDTHREYYTDTYFEPFHNTRSTVVQKYYLSAHICNSYNVHFWEDSEQPVIYPDLFPTYWRITTQHHNRPYARLELLNYLQSDIKKKIQDFHSGTIE
jgi:hypothetical protein